MLKKLKGLFGKKESYNDNEDRVFTGKELDDAYTRGLDEGRKELATAVRQANGEGRATGYDKGFEAALKSSSRNLKPSINENQKLSFTERRKSKKLRDKLLNDIEEILENTTAGSVRGASIVKEKGKIKILEINSKTEALDLVRRAQKGEIRIIM